MRVESQEIITIKENIDTSRMLVAAARPEKITDEMLTELLSLLDSNLSRIQVSVNILLRRFEEGHKFM